MPGLVSYVALSYTVFPQATKYLMGTWQAAYPLNGCLVITREVATVHVSLMCEDVGLLVPTLSP